MKFGEAIEVAKRGGKISRNEWNGRCMFVIIAYHLDTANFARWIPNETPVLPFFAMYNAQKELVVGWLASQTDMLAEDWFEM